MKNEQMEENHKTHSKFATVCLKSCLRLMERIAKVKQAVLNEFHDTLDAHNQMLRLAVNEAEALAWQTDYPHLVFPALAHEKAEEVTSWQSRQREINRAQSQRPQTSQNYLTHSFPRR